MKKILLLAFLLILCTAFAGHRIFAERIILIGRENPGERIVREKTPIIQGELAGLNDHPWAGKYWCWRPLTATETLLIAPESGFVYTRVTDYSRYDYNYGGVICEDGRLKLLLMLENDLEENSISLRAEYFLIPWGEELYLVPPEKMMAFCDDFNSGSEPFFFFRKMEKDSGLHPKLAGIPEVPDEYEKYLLKKPLDAEILSIGEPKEDAFPVTLNGGSRDGLYAGMKLWVTASVDSKTRMNFLEITTVSETQAEGIFRRYSKDSEPQPGWRLSTPRKWMEK